MTATAAGQVSRSRSTDKRYYGVVEAVVAAVNDPEKLGRVKLRFPWFDPSMTTEWCRVRQDYAGGGYGSFFVPEPEDEVLVAFVHGDMRMPVVLGGLYNGVDRPPTHRSSSRDEKVIRTKGGHQITLSDTNGAHRITIVDSSGNSSITIDTRTNAITIEAKEGKLTLKGKGVEIESTAGMNVRAQSTMDLKATQININ